MMRGFLQDAFFLAWTGLWRLLRVREVLMWTFLMPPLFFYFLGLVNGGETPNRRDALAVSVAPDAGFLADDLIAQLEKREFRIVRPKTREEFLDERRRLEIPSGFTASVLAGNHIDVRFTRKGDDLNADYDRIRVTRAINNLLAAIAVSNGKADVMRELEAGPRTLQLEVKSAGKRVVPPSGYQQSVPGSMVMFTLIVLFTGGAASLTWERRMGLLRRLASSPVSRGAVVLGRWGSRMALGVVQILFAMILGRLLFHVDWGPHPAMVIAMLFAYGALAATLGILLGNFGRTEGQVVAIGVIASNLLAGLGGCWWPIEVAPLWAQRIAIVLPTGWAMDALHKLVSFGNSPASVIPHVCAMLAAAVVAGYVLARSFRFQ
jgi:ABC-type multidrug transport system permease subunit